MKHRWSVGFIFLAAIPIILGTAIRISASNITYRVWTSNQGKKVTALLVEEKDDIVQLKKPDGQKMMIKRSALSVDDQAYLDSMRREREAAIKAAEEAARKAEEEPEIPALNVPSVPLVPESEGPVWLLTNCTISSVVNGKDISAEYKEQVDNIMITKRPPGANAPDGYKLIVLKCSIAALGVDPKALDKLALIRKIQADIVPYAGKSLLVSDSDRDQLKGQYMVFDLGNMALTNTERYVFKPQWLVRPDEYRGPYLLKTVDGAPQFGAVARAPRPWNKTCQEEKGFSGLLESGKLVDLQIIFAVPKAINLAGLRAQIEKQESVPVTVESK